ncbi:MAG TPA: dienelactone hydrolase family protein [Acetobacteraceae bacterium]|jgi:carboxymethylenebutenolidase
MGSTIELTAADGHRFSAWQDGPKGARHALVVVQEIFGVNHHMRNVCAELAAAGYAVIAPALFDRAERGVELGYTAEDVARGRDLRAKVPDVGVVADVEASAVALAGKTLGIIGYCWGGTVAWWGATRSKQFKAAIGWYGGGIAATRTEAPHCPVQLHFGEKDSGIPLTDVEAIRAAQSGVEIFVYPGAQHGFGCDDRASYSAPDAKLAQERSLAFFAKHLA